MSVSVKAVLYAFFRLSHMYQARVYLLKICFFRNDFSGQVDVLMYDFHPLLDIFDIRAVLHLSDFPEEVPVNYCVLAPH